MTQSWHDFLDLGEEILRHVDIQAQSEAIISRIQENNEYQADVWFNEIISRIPGHQNLALFPSAPQSLLMQRTLESRKVCYIGKSRNPKIFTKKECAYTIAYPLIVQDSLLGVVQVIRCDSRPLSIEEAEYFEGLSAHAAVALQISHQTIIKNWRLEQLSLVRSVSSKIANSQNLDELATQVTRLIRDTFHYYCVSVFTLEPGSNQLRFRAFAGPELDTDRPKPIIEAQLGRGIIGTVARDGIEVLANDVSRDSRFAFSEQLPLTKAEVVFPLKVEDRILGVLNIESDHVYAFHEMDMLVLRSLADNIALAVEGTRLYTNLQRRLEELATVAEVGKAVSSILDFKGLLQQVVDIIFEKFHYPYVHLFLVNEELGTIVYQAGAGDRSQKLEKNGLAFSLEDSTGIIPWVAKHRQTRIANDVGKDKKYRPSGIDPDGTSSEMAIPLIFANQVLGVLDIQSDQTNSFDDEDKFLFEALADAVAIAIRNAILYNSEHWRRQAADSLGAVAGLLSSNAELDRLLDVILTELERILPCTATAIWLMNDANYQDLEQAQRLELAAVHGVEARIVRETIENNPESTHWLRKALSNTQPTIRTESDIMDPLGWSLGYINEYSAIAAPLKVGNQPLGVLVLVHRSSGKFGKESSQLSAAFASYASVAIQNARLYSSAQEQAWISTVLLQVAEATQSLTSVEDLLNAVVSLTPMLVGIKGCGVFIWEPNIERFTLNGTHGMHSNCSGKDEVYIVKNGEAPALDQLRDVKTPIFINDLESDIPFICMDEEQNEAIKMVLLPLVSRGIILGACLVAYAVQDKPTSFDPIENERLAIIQGIAHQTAIAIENIRLLETQQQETYISAALLQVAQTVVSHNNMEDLYSSIVHITPILVGSEICLIYVWNSAGEAYQLVESNGIKWQILESNNQTELVSGQFPLLDLIRKQDKMCVLPVCESNPDDPLCWADIDLPENAADYDFDLNSDPLLIGMPLSVKGEVYGILLVKDPGTDRMFLQKRLEILTGIAQQTALAIQNDRLQNMVVVRERLEREFQIAREIQRTFLPSELPQYSGWKMDVRWRPAREVGGDFYDIFQLPDNRLAIVVADVTDKGMSAALYMTVTRTLIRTVARQFSTPAEILSNVNDLLLRDTPHGMYITAFLGILDQQTGDLNYANAGHNLPIFKRTDGKIDKLTKGGMPLGIIEDLSLINHQGSVAVGDSLIMYTDGVTETSTAIDFFGDKRLENAIREAADQEPVTILDAIDNALIEFQESDIPADDVTILAVHRCDGADF